MPKPDMYIENYMVIIFKTLANHIRLKVLKLMIANKAPMTVNAIADNLQLDQGNLSHNLIRMRKDGVLTVKQVGTTMLYSIKDPNVENILRAIKG